MLDIFCINICNFKYVLVFFKIFLYIFFEKIKVLMLVKLMKLNSFLFKLLIYSLIESFFKFLLLLSWFKSLERSL